MDAVKDMAGGGKGGSGSGPPGDYLGRPLNPPVVSAARVSQGCAFCHVAYDAALADTDSHHVNCTPTLSIVLAGYEASWHV